MVLAVETPETSKASVSSEVKCEQKENGLNDTLLDELKTEFESLATTADFNRVGCDVKPVFATKERIVCEMTLGPGHVNAKGTLHGGQTAALTDIVTARALGQTIKDRPMASIELSVIYMLPVKLGEVIEITANVLKIGRNVAFSEAEFRRKSDGKLAAKGRHTVAILPKPAQEGEKM
ncbi:unnamed protein product [Cylicocyclus nassatus]|uniref:Acyl-coenzyme A thioesterase 13 n=1 Tax=Cylicocyclus nassatus TaxID=53992 RepID=A0AA36M4M8_CYLNA|nr:unnamed protein product [Cylicocyclus nassatus]